MRRASIILPAVVLAAFVFADQASAQGWRLPRRSVRWVIRNVRQDFRIRNTQDAHHVVPSFASAETEPSANNEARPRPTPAPELTARELASNPAYRALSDEEKCALLGRERAYMVYPHDGETDPYPVCRAWKWDDEDGWDWDWSEINCPWKQCHDCDDD